MRWYEKIIEAHVAVAGDAVSHYGRMKSSRYFVWQEDGASDLNADGKHLEKVMMGTTDLFTKTEFDPWVDELGKSFDAHGIAWTLNPTQYEPETGFIHTEWSWEVEDGKD